ncbi:MAG TPA: hypothetical protein VIL18_09345 [Longimicrobiales bacterium]
MTVPIQISWDLYLGQVSVWCECLVAGVRRAVLLPRLDTIFSPEQEDPAREVPYRELKWRLVSPTEADWERYRELAQKQAARHGISLRTQRVEKLAGWAGGPRVPVPQYHLWLYRDAEVGAAIDELYEELDPARRRALWSWLLQWTAPVAARQPYDPSRG